MPIYFASSDESGNFQKNASKRFIKSNPYYSRATVLMKADDWKSLSQKLVLIRKNYGIPGIVEVKWSHIWSIYKHEKDEKEIIGKKPYSLLSVYANSSKLLDFADQVLQLLNEITVSDNKEPIDMPEAWHLERHLQEHMQRIEMEIEDDDSNLAIIFADPLSEKKDRWLREAYHEMYKSGDFVKYTHIKDSLNFEYSHHSAGIQIADFIAGSFNGLLRGFSNSSELFLKRVKPFLRTGQNSKIMGYGIREVPRNDKFRKSINEKLARPEGVEPPTS